MGDLVVTEAELAPVEESLVGEGLSITAVHNLLAGKTPVVLYLHYNGHGAAEPLAKAVARAFERTGTPRQMAVGQLSTVSIDTAASIGC